VHGAKEDAKERKVSMELATLLNMVMTVTGLKMVSESGSKPLQAD
jgi:hypothetical protein